MILHTKAARTILLSIAFVLLGCAAFLVATDPEMETVHVTTSISESIEQSATPVPEATEPTPTSKPEFTSQIDGISINPCSQQVTQGQIVSIDIQAHIEGFGISGAELEITFDPTILQVTNLSQGNLLGNSPLVAIEAIDNSTGQIHYALARKGTTQPTDSSDTVATLWCTISNSASIGKSNVTIKSAKLTDDQFKERTGFGIQNGSVDITH